MFRFNRHMHGFFWQMWKVNYIGKILTYFLIVRCILAYFILLAIVIISGCILAWILSSGAIQIMTEFNQYI